MPQLKKTILIVSLFIIISIGLLPTTLYCQSVTYSAKNIGLEEAFTSIKKQTGYVFFYNSSILKQSKPFDINVTNATINDVMDICLKNQHLNYTIKDKTIVIGIIQEPTHSNEKKNIQNEAKTPIEITGIVKDEKDIPLEGVTISVIGTTVATNTDKNGRYKLKLNNEKSVIRFSHIGYGLQTKSFSGSNSIDVVLKTESVKLDDIVIVNIGYGTSTKKDVTGAISKASVEDMTKAPISNITEALAGRMAGVVVSSGDGQPGALPKIVIRGNNSVTQDNSPLYVIDGFPVENPNSGALNPDDIESMEVLKDASATAIYGARGANGVIIITTKKGKVGPSAFRFSYSNATQKNEKKIPLMNPYQYVSYLREWDSLTNNFASLGGVTTTTYATDATYMQYWPIDKYKTVPSTNMQDYMYTNAPMNNYNLSLSGGTPQTRYFISGNLVDQKGILINSGYQRYSGRIVIDQIVNSQLKIGFNTNYAFNKQWGGAIEPSDINNYSGSGSAPNYTIYGYRPVTPLNKNGYQSVDIQGDFTDPNLYSPNGVATSMIVNPYINQLHILNQTNTNNLASNAYLDYQIVPAILTLRVTVGVTTNNPTNIQFYDTLTQQGSPKTNPGQLNGVHGSITNNLSTSWVNENTLVYNKKINYKNTLNVLLGLTESGIKTSSNGSSAINLPNPSLGISGLDEGTPIKIIANSSNSTLASLLSRINYNYNSKYYFTASFRADGSSRFSPNNRWAYFPSGSIKWRFSEESFLKANNILTDGGLRISYGLTGNNRVSDFPYLTPMTFQQNQYIFNGTQITGAYPSALSNPSLKWETTEQTNIGTDLEFFKKVSLTIDGYRKVTKDLLLNATVPTSFGYSTVFKNVGRIQNQGIELSIRSKNIDKGNLIWSTDFNISWNQSKVLSLTDNQEAITPSLGWDANFSSSPAYITKVGQPLGQYYGLVWDGVYGYNDFNYSTSINSSAVNAGMGSHYVLKNNVPTNGSSRGNIQPGDIRYKDLNADGVVNTSDFTVIGRGLPIHTGGIGNNIKYKNVDLNVFFQWSYGNNVLNANRIIFDGNNGSYNINQFATYVNRWTPTNTNTSEYRTGGAGPRGLYSSRTVEDGSYIRLKTIQIGYNVPATFLKRYHLKSVRFYLSAQNLITWTKYTGQDPEISTYNSVLTPNFDWSGYPRARVINLGVNLFL